jgi:hypothetical protein
MSLRSNQSSAYTSIDVEGSFVLAVQRDRGDGAMGPEEEIMNPVGYRDGLIIALLSLRPVRMRTFSLMRVGKHLQQVVETDYPSRRTGSAGGRDFTHDCRTANDPAA